MQTTQECPEGPVMSQAAGPWIRDSFLGDNGERGRGGAFAPRAHDVCSARHDDPRRVSTHTHVANGGWNLLRFWRQVSGKSLTHRQVISARYRRKEPEARPQKAKSAASSFAFLCERKQSAAADCSSATLISWSGDRVVTSRILRTLSASPRLINFLPRRSRCRCGQI